MRGFPLRLSFFTFKLKSIGFLQTISATILLYLRTSKIYMSSDVIKKTSYKFTMPNNVLKKLIVTFDLRAHVSSSTFK